MAEGLLRDLGGKSFAVASAGVEPSFVRAEAIAVMNEIGIDISAHRSKSVDEFLNQEFDYVITVCDNANARCPVFPGRAQRIHWSIEDPAPAKGDAERRLASFRKARDQLQVRLAEFVAAEEET